MRLAPPPEERGGARPVLEGLHPRDRAGVPQADDRAARRRSSPRRSRRWSTAPRYVDDRLREIIDELEPDVIVEDNVVAFPALPASGRPWVRIVSCNPTEVRDPDVPPPFSGYPADDRAGWAAYWDEYGAHARRAARDLQRVLRGARRAAAAGARVHARVAVAQPHALSRRGRLPARPRRSASSWHNLADQRPRHRRAVGAPGAARRREGPLVYLSLGSLGSADVDADAASSSTRSPTRPTA